jgi:dUTP pyrophosphatase
MVSTGISLAVPEGYVGLLFMRSGLSTKGINLSNSVGVIDSDYRGEVWLSLINNSNTTITLNKGDRVAQIAFMSITQFPFVNVDKLSYTVRGEGRFGSTGV